MIDKRSWQRILIISLFALCFVKNSFSQEFSRVIPPSPNASSLGVFGDIPVGYYTGTPEISIPIYEIKSGKLSLPITLSYDATGIRVSQDASWVGLGWSLAAGGIVTRSIRGKDDFQGYYINEKLPANDEYNEYYRADSYYGLYPANAVDSTSIHDGLYFKEMKSGSIDGEPDIFSYSFGVYSGKFVLDKQQNGSGIFFAKRNNLGISFNSNGTGFTITAPDGNKYLFGTSEWVISRYNNTTIEDPSTVVGVNGLNKGYLEAPSTWHLDKIVSPYGDTIGFTYSFRESLNLTRKNEKFFNALSTQNNGPVAYADVTVSREHFNDVYVSKISFKNGWIDFETNDRLDIGYGTCNFYCTQATKIIKNKGL